MSKTTLIIDGNFFLISRYKGAMREHTFFGTPDQQQQSVDKLLTVLSDSLSHIISSCINICDDVVIVTDGGSWRKSIVTDDIMKKFKYTQYKSNRVKDTTINWKLIFETFNKWVGLCNTKVGIKYLYGGDVEGDDWIYMVCNRLYSQNQNAIIFANDADLQQLIKYNTKTGNYITYWNNKKNWLFVDENMYNDLNDFNNNDTTSMFDQQMLFELKNSRSEEYRQNLERIQQWLTTSSITKNCNVIGINPFKCVIIPKIICGDEGDNIYPILYKKSKTTKDIHRLTEKKLTEIFDKYVTEIPTANNIEDIVNQIYSYFMTLPNSIKLEKNDFIELFNLNLRLVYLDQSSYPAYIVEKMLYCMSKLDFETTCCDIKACKNSTNIYINKSITEEILNNIPDSFMVDLPINNNSLPF